MARFEHGWVRVHRKLLNQEWTDALDAIGKGLFLQLLLMANWKDSEKPLFKHKDICLKAGQLATSYTELCTKLDITPFILRDRLERLETLGTITRQTDNHGTIITICNFSKYQRDDNDESHTEPHANSTANLMANSTANLTHSKELKKETTKERVSVAPTGNVKEFITHYCDEFMNTYGTNPVFMGRTIGTAKRIVNDLGLETATKLIKAYFQIRIDPWFTSKRHSLDLFEKNIEAIKVFAETGKYITIQHAQSRERQLFKK